MNAFRDCPIFEIKSVEAGEPARRLDYISVPDTCVIVCRNKEGNIALVRQFRPILNRYSLELPGGSVEDGESFEAAALRELKEEVGCAACQIHLVLTIVLSVGTSDERVHIFSAGADNYSFENVAESRIEVIWINQADAIRMVRSQDLVDAKTLIGLQNA